MNDRYEIEIENAHHIELSYLVWKILKYSETSIMGKEFVRPFNPIGDWIQASALINEFGIKIEKGEDYFDGEYWYGTHPEDKHRIGMYGETPAEAGIRALCYGEYQLGRITIDAPVTLHILMEQHEDA